ncbi:MAG TPA: VWA domain-containing protein [Polyangiales bacterium]|nr:VWA domain-containing protein [Polyangiales bacterium]
MEDREEEQRLSFVASAIAGVPLTVSFGDKLASCDGASLRLPRSAEPRRLVVAAHALLVAAHSLHTPSLSKLIGRPRAARRFLALELQRALAGLGERLPHTIESALRVHAQSVVSGSAEQSLRRALDSKHPVVELPAYFGTVRGARLTWARLRGKQAAPPKTSHGTLAQHDDDDELDHDPSTKKLLTLFTSPLGGGPVGDLFLKLMGFGRSPGAGEGDDAGGGGAQALGGEATTTGPATQSSEQLAQRSRLLAPDAPRGFQYPEWHDTVQRYRPAWCDVLEFAPEPPEHGVARERSRIPKRALRAQLARVGVEFQRHRGQLDGEELDLDRVVRFATDPDRQADARLYSASRRTKRDLTLLVLLDISQSTADKNEAGESIFGQQRELARELVRSAHALGDRVALYGYHSRGRHHVHCLRVKGFSEPFGTRTERRLDALQPGGLSRLGAAVRHASHLLGKETQHSHRLLLVLSDGFAYDDGYEHGYAEADTAKALAEASKRGIACVCLNVGSDQDDATLSRLYGESAYLRCESPRRAVPALRKLIRSAMTSSQ